MNSIARARLVERGRKLVVEAMRAGLERGGDPLTIVFLAIHRTSPASYRANVEAGGVERDGFVVHVAPRSPPTNEVISAIPADLIACLVSVDDEPQFFGLDFERRRMADA